MNANNPLHKSLEDTYFEGGKDYQYGAYIPPIVLSGSTPTQPSPTPTKSPTPTPTKTPTQTPTPSSQYVLLEAENCCAPYNVITIGLLQGVVYNQDAGVVYGGNSYVIIGNGSGSPVQLYSTTTDNICSTITCPSPTPTPTKTTTPTPTSSPGSSPTPTPTNTPTISVSATRTPTPTPTISVSPSQTPTGTPTSTPTKTPSPTPTKTPTQTPTMTNSPTPTPTQTRTPTPTPSCSSCCRKYSVFNESYTLTGVYLYTACNCLQVNNKQIPPRTTQVVCCNVKCVCAGGNYKPTSAQSFVKITEIGCC